MGAEKSSLHMAKDDLYAVLGASGNRNASATELKRSYRLLASKAHPDKVCMYGAGATAARSITSEYNQAISAV